ncbi:MAG: CHAT domain-containing protein [Streptosporangiaceae bacterium]
MDRLLIDLDVNGQVAISTWLDGEFPETAGEPFSPTWPLSDGELDELRWYLEDYLRVPFAVYEDRGAAIAARLPEWGRSMFSALFSPGPARDAYVRLRTRAISPGSVEIVVRSASPAWLGLPWELLCDPSRATPVALDGIGISRSVPSAGLGDTFRVEGNRLRVLMVISRPSGTGDVGYQMIARPLMRRLEAVRGLVEVDVLRPPTLEALTATLHAARKAGNPYQIVHFDGHGMLGEPLTAADASLRYGTPGQGVLIFEKPGGGADHVPAARIAQVLGEARVPVVVLNACQSGAVGKELQAAVATRLLADGASAVVAMAYSVYAVAAAEFMAVFYERLFAGDPMGEAVRVGRARMAERPERPSPKGNLLLADWLIPVHYQRREVRFPQLRTTSRTEVSLASALDRLREPDAPDGALAATGVFVGRDDLFYTLEAAARGQQVVVLHGPAGTGKTELARAFGRWWRDTGGVDRPEWVIWHSFEPGVASFGLDGVIAAIGLQAFGRDFASQDAKTRRELVRNLLIEQRLLLIVDNFESARSMPDPSAATPALDETRGAELKDFLTRAAAGRSMLVVTSRTPEAWLGEARRIQVGGLRHHEAIEYADQLLASFPAAAPRRAKRAFGELLKWLDGHPLSMRLTLPHLDTMDAAAVLDGLRGVVPLPETGGTERTTSLSASVAYSMAHLNAMDRQLLVAVSLFEGVASAEVLSELSAHDQAPGRFSGIGLARWMEVLDWAAHLGLLTTLGAGLYVIHPALPAYLAGQWRADDHDGSERAEAERLLVDVCTSYGLWLWQQIEEGDAAEAYCRIGFERRTLGRLLARALEDRLWEQAFALAVPLNEYWDRNGLAEEADAWADRALLALEGPDGAQPPPDGVAGGLWRFFLGAKAARLNLSGRHDVADAIYAQINDTISAQEDSPEHRVILAIGYHQRGIAALKRGELDEAERWHRQALGINEEFGHQAGIASSCQELGFVAQQRQDWDQAEQWYRRSLAIKERLGDRRRRTVIRSPWAH